MMTTVLHRFRLVAFLLVAPFIFSSCNPDEEDTTPTPTPQTPSDWWDPHYAKFTVDGSLNYHLIEGQDGVGTGLAGDHSINAGAMSKYAYGYNIYRDVAVDTEDVGLTIFLVHSTDQYVDDDAFAAMFSTGPRPYAPAGVQFPTGMEVTLGYGMGEYSTRYAPGTQTGSAFTIVQHTPYHIWGQRGQFVKVTFNCKLYNSSGNMITLTNGEAVISLEVL